MTGRRVTREEAIERYRRQSLQSRDSRARFPRANRSRSTRSASSPICAAAATRIPPARSAPSSSSASRALTGAATNTTRAAAHLRHGVSPRPPNSTRYLTHIEEAAQARPSQARRELDLFSIEEDAGGGLVFWLPKGAIVRGIVEDFIREGLRERGYQPGLTPHVAHENLYEISGHLENYARRTCSGRSTWRAALPAQADELSRPHPDLSQRSALVSRSAAALLGIRHRLSLRAQRHAARHARGFAASRRTTRTSSAPPTVAAEFEQTADEALRMIDAFGFTGVSVLALHPRGEAQDGDRSDRRGGDPQGAGIARPALTNSTKAAALSTGRSSTSKCATRSAASGNSAPCRSTSCCRNASTSNTAAPTAPITRR